MDADYHVCRTWDGTTEGATDVYIAKPFEMRGPASAVLNGVTVAYTAYDWAAQKRHASGDAEEDEQITQPYTVNDPIYAMSANTLAVDPDGIPITLLDTNPGAHAWMSIS